MNEYNDGWFILLGFAQESPLIYLWDELSIDLNIK